MKTFKQLKVGDAFKLADETNDIVYIKLLHDDTMQGNAIFLCDGDILTSGGIPFDEQVIYLGRTKFSVDISF